MKEYYCKVNETPDRTDKVVKCLICGVERSGDSALTHWKETGHNLWELILPSGVEEKE